jgi:IS1 family transposase
MDDYRQKFQYCEVCNKPTQALSGTHIRCRKTLEAIKNTRSCDVCKKPTQALNGIHSKCMKTYVRMGRRSKAFQVKKCGFVY